MLKAKKRVRGAHYAPTTLTLAFVSETFRACLSGVDLASIEQNYDAYCTQRSSRGVAERTGASGRFGLEALLEKDLTWIEADDVEGVTEGALLATGLLISAERQDVSVFEEGIV